MLQQDTGDQDVNYHLRADRFVRFREMIYVLKNIEFKNIILIKFHAKPY